MYSQPQRYYHFHLNRNKTLQSLQEIDNAHHIENPDQDYLHRYYILGVKLLELDYHIGSHSLHWHLIRIQYFVL
jgi:hypothetical protein